MNYAISPADVAEAAVRCAGFIHCTPVMTSHTFNQRTGRSVWFKCENFQKTGSFKFRGATNAVRALSEADAARGVVTHSSGNHAQALALAARERGIQATIVMPRTAATVKKSAVKDYGGTVVECEPNLAARELACAEIAERTGATTIPPFDHPHVMAGQGTAALELLEEVPTLDALVVPVGGGGLLSGFTIAAHGFNPNLRIFGAEPLGADDAARSKAAKTWCPQTAPNSIADGLLTSLGQLTWPIVRDRVEQIFTVNEEEIRAAMHFVWERMKLIIEPSAAVGVAVVQSAAFRELVNCQRVGVVLCGGNVSLDKLYW